jgi:hypothetical protein
MQKAIPTKQAKHIVNSFPKRCEGAALVESCIVIIILCLILFGILQLSILTAAHDVNIYAASSGARCAAVGYDNDMVEKSIRIAALANMGPRPDMDTATEKFMAREYLLTDDSRPLYYVPAEYWDSLFGLDADRGGDVVRVRLTQNYPLAIPFVRAFYPGEALMLDSGDVEMMNHAALYLGSN